MISICCLLMIFSVQSVLQWIIIFKSFIPSIYLSDPQARKLKDGKLLRYKGQPTMPTAIPHFKIINLSHDPNRDGIGNEIVNQSRNQINVHHRKMFAEKFFSSKWKDTHAVLYDDSTFAWFDDKKDLE